MRIRKLFSCLVLCSVTLACSSANAFAQREMYTAYSLELLAAKADAIVRGRVLDVGPEEHDQESQWRVLTIGVQENISGYFASPRRKSDTLL